MDIAGQNARQFFADARERQAIYRKRQRGEPWPWTQDEVMQRVYLCNLFREQDKTTAWFREYVRGQLSRFPVHVLAAIVLFRWFNRIETGEFLFKKTNLFNEWLGFLMAKTLTPAEAGEWLAGEIEMGMEPPYFTGAYMIKADNNISKHLSVSMAAGHVVRGYIDKVAEFGGPVLFETLERWTDWLTGFHGLGGFMAYEIVTDLRWTPLAHNCTDINTWANIGPGCARGLSRLYYNDHEHAQDFMRDKYKAVDVMKWLLSLSRQQEYWPQGETPWEMREVEHELCEFDKIQRCRLGQGRIKRWYRPPISALPQTQKTVAIEAHV